MIPKGDCFLRAGHHVFFFTPKFSPTLIWGVVNCPMTTDLRMAGPSFLEPIDSIVLNMKFNWSPCVVAHNISVCYPESPG